jgi:predicted patatin/cPLA2 family phospholipase
MLENTGLVLEGGGFRGIFVASALEVLYKNNLFFPYVVGVSAGAAYGVSYVTRQQGRNLETNQYINDKRYCGFKHLLTKRNYFNWEFMYKEIPVNHSPLDYPMLENSSTRFEAVITNCKTAQAEYIPVNNSSADRMRDILTATSSLPFISKMKEIDNNLYLDGGLADPIPIKQAFSQNNKRLVVVLTRPKGYQKEEGSSTAFFFKLFYRKYPQLVKLMQERTAKYNNQLAEIEQLSSQGKIFVIQPENAIQIGRLENNPQVLEKVYFDSMKAIEKDVFPKLRNWLEESC